jgi:hypothetical protein
MEGLDEMREPMETRPLSTPKIPNPNACADLHVTVNVRDGTTEYECKDGSWWRCNKNTECPICYAKHAKSTLPVKATIEIMEGLD